MEKSVVYAKDVEDLACFIMEARNLTPSSSMIQIGIDDGQGLLKIMMSIKEKENESEVKGKKSKYYEGFAPREIQTIGCQKIDTSIGESNN